MVKRVVFSLLVCALLALALPAAAQEEGQIRIVQIFYTSADVYVDDALTYPALPFTVGTDYLSLPAGTHRIAIAPKDAGIESSVPTELTVEADHRYTIVTMGAFESGMPDLTIIDETTAFAENDPRGNNAIIIQNVPAAIPVDVWFVDELKIENLLFGGYGTASAPLGHFSAQAVMAGNKDAVVFESEYFAVPGTLSLAYLSGTFPDQINRTFYTTTDDNMADYLAAHTALADSKLTTLVELINAAGSMELLQGETPFTLFAPTNDAFAALPAGTLDALKADPAALLNVLSYHLVPGRLTPYELFGEQALTSVQGGELAVAFDPAATPLSVNGIVTGLQHRVSNGVIYLIDSVLLPPAA